MQVQRFTDVEEFSRRAEPFLVAHEAEHNLQLGILHNLRVSSDYSDYPPYLALVEDGDTILAAALRTPPYPLIVSLVVPAERTQDAVRLLVADAHALYGHLPGINGPATVSRAFADAWQALTGEPYHAGMKDRVYELDEVVPVTSVPGSMRPAAEADRALLTEWLAAFHDEALQAEVDFDAATWVDHALTTGSHALYLWEDGAVVSLAASGSSTPHGIRIGPVYTPPRFRGRGYASACVAALSQLQLDHGRRFCFLYTDLANPTSNKIYQAIGYRPVLDVDIYLFE